MIIIRKRKNVEHKNLSHRSIGAVHKNALAKNKCKPELTGHQMPVNAKKLPVFLLSN